VRYWLSRPDEQAPGAPLLLVETVTFDREERNLAGTAVRIENSSRAHAESLGAALAGYQTELVSRDGRWQLEVEIGELGPLLRELFGSVGRWLDQSRVDSLLLHLDGQEFTLLRPSAERQPDSTASLLERVAQLETALETRIVIEQAKGIVARAAGVDIEAAFDLIRGTARSRRVELHSVAVAIVAKPGEAESQLRQS
jgi:ANTAR domain